MMVTVVMIPMLEVSNQAPESKATFVHLFIYEFDKTVSWGKSACQAQCRVTKAVDEEDTALPSESIVWRGDGEVKAHITGCCAWRGWTALACLPEAVGCFPEGQALC